MQAISPILAHVEAPHAHTESPSFWWRYVFATDHKVIGLQYGFTGLLFLLFGFGLILLMRWQLAYPGQPIPVVGHLLRGILGDQMVMGNGGMTPDLYNAFGAMHGTIMVFLGVVPVVFGAFGNYFCAPADRRAGHGLSAPAWCC